MARRRWKMDEIKAIVAGENPFIQSGYTKAYKARKIGDEWTDGKGIVWKKTEGGEVRVNKQMDSIREMIKSRCSVCNMDVGLFGDKTDSKMYAKTGKCFSCVEVEEQILKADGKYNDYEQRKFFFNKLSTVKEFRKNVEETIAYLKKGETEKVEMVCSNGVIVKWEGGPDLTPILKEAEEDLIKADQEIKDLEHAISQLK